VSDLPGTYALVLFAPREACVQVGKLGELRVRRGTFVYVGSAFGPGGVAARVRHHVCSRAAPRWHLDWLRDHLRPREVWLTHDGAHREHEWARIFQDLPGASAPLAGFGASDCRCPAHLFRFASPPSAAMFRRRLGRTIPGHAPVRIVPADRMIPGVGTIPPASRGDRRVSGIE